jgi:predicted nucleotide-binding protein
MPADPSPARFTSTGALFSALTKQAFILRRMGMATAKVFIGSSSEGIEIANNIKLNLSKSARDVEVTVWTEGVFLKNRSFLESLLIAVEKFDFAIIVLTADDFIESRNKEGWTARDNTLFELGLFMGRLGRERTFFVYQADNEELKIPSDLSGIHSATYTSRSDDNLLAALTVPCTEILSVIRKEGARPPFLAAKNIDSTYRLTETLHILDMTRRVATGSHNLETPFSEVALHRRDIIQKQLDKDEDFIAYFGTTGLEIKLESIKCSPTRSEDSSIKSEFALRKKDNPFEDPLRKSYNLRLHTADRPEGDELEVISNFTFWNAFQTEDKEWWSTDVKYQIDKAIVILKFPDDKPCTQIKLSVKTEGEEIKELEDDPPIITKGGKHVYWTGINLICKSKYIFEFRW